MSDSDVELYLREISRYQLLTVEEERELARRVRQGDQEARNEMVRANLRLVIAIAKNYVERGLSLLDLVEEGNIGLLKAVERFNPDEGCKFSTYASWWIKQTVRRALINKVKNVRVPAYMVEVLTRWRRSTEKLTQRMGCEPTTEEVARDVGLSTDKLLTLHRAIYAHGAALRGEAGAFVQDIEDESAVAPGGEGTIVDRTDGHSFDQMLSVALSEREDLILRMRFGIGSANTDFGLLQGATATLDQIGQRIGLTRERVRQIEAQALKKLFCFLTGAQLPVVPQRRSRKGPARRREKPQAYSAEATAPAAKAGPGGAEEAPLDDAAGSRRASRGERASRSGPRKTEPSGQRRRPGGAEATKKKAKKVRKNAEKSGQRRGPEPTPPKQPLRLRGPDRAEKGSKESKETAVGTRRSKSKRAPRTPQTKKRKR